VLYGGNEPFEGYVANFSESSDNAQLFAIEIPVISFKVELQIL
jgi:hypothetical protein